MLIRAEDLVDASILGGPAVVQSQATVIIIYLSATWRYWAEVLVQFTKDKIRA